MRATTIGASIASDQARFTTNTVISKDGTTIGYRQLGHGPALVILHGSMSTGYYHLELAEALADTFTIILPDRRGFGLSASFNTDGGIEKDVEDLDALLTQTDAHDVFGVSAGAIICLRAALDLPAIRRLAIYEPPLFANSAKSTAMIHRFDAEMARGKVGAALTTVMKGAPLISDIFSALPRPLLEFMTNKMLSFNAKNGYQSFRELAPTLHHDGQIISEMSGQQDSLEAIRAEMLILGGSKSTSFLKAGLDSVAQVLPRAKRVTLSGLNHSSPWNTDLRGKPAPLAQELRRFFALTTDNDIRSRSG